MQSLWCLPLRIIQFEVPLYCYLISIVEYLNCRVAFRNIHFMQWFSRCCCACCSLPLVRTFVLFLMLGDNKESWPKDWLNFCMCEQRLCFGEFPHSWLILWRSLGKVLGSPGNHLDPPQDEPWARASTEWWWREGGHWWREGVPAADRRTALFSDDIFDLILQEIKTCHRPGRVSTRMIFTLKRVKVLRGWKHQTF